MRRIGSGGMGVVYLARHRRMNREVALKAIPPAAPDRVHLRERFAREVEVTARLSHPNVVVAHDAREDEGVCYLVTAYLEGGDLGRLVRRGGPLPVPVAVRAVRDAALGLGHAHERGVVHRDVKPSNLLTDASGRVCVADWGLTKAGITSPAARKLTAAGVTLGTVDYLAPELAGRSGNADARSDVYSLGCVLFFLLTGRPAVQPAAMWERLDMRTGSPGPGRSTPPAGTAAPLAELVARMLAKRPEDRPANMNAVVDVLNCADPLRAKQPEEGGRSRSRALDFSPETPRGRGRARAARRNGVRDLTRSRARRAMVIRPRHRPNYRDGPACAGDRRDAVREREGVPAALGGAPRCPRRADGNRRRGELPVRPDPARNVPHGKPRGPDRGAAAPEHRRMDPKNLPRGEGAAGHRPAGVLPRPNRGDPRAVQVVRVEDRAPDARGADRLRLGLSRTRGEVEARGGFRLEVRGRIPAGPDHPAINIGSNDAVAFCKWLGKEVGAACRLPAESEWEFACRGGRYGYWGHGDDAALLTEFAVYGVDVPSAVGTREPNGFGLFDMHGNASERCAIEDRGPTTPPPRGPRRRDLPGSRRAVQRGAAAAGVWPDAYRAGAGRGKRRRRSRPAFASSARSPDVVGSEPEA